MGFTVDGSGEEVAVGNGASDVMGLDGCANDVLWGRLPNGNQLYGWKCFGMRR